MNLRRSLVTVALAGVLLASCSDSRSSNDSTSSAGATTTVVSTTTTQPPATTAPATSPPTTAATPPSTTPTIPAVVGLTLSADGLGDESFGAEAEGVIAYVESILGSPTEDSGWNSPAGGEVCGGTEYRVVTWVDLTLQFADASPLSTGLRQFINFTYGPASGAVIDPFGLGVAGGISVGDTVDELLASYPSTLISFDEEVNSTSFQIVDGLGGYLTGEGGSDTIKNFLGGFFCGA